MADAAMVANLSTLAAVSAAGAAAASAGASRSRYRRAQSACYQGTSLNTASYMNNLRTPAYPLRSPGASNGRGGGGGGIGVHIHYHGRCPHHYDLRRSPSPPDDGLFSPYSERDYTYPQDYCPSRYPSYKGYPGSDCGCTQCYWRDFLTNDLDKYKTARAKLRETYLWNLHELVRRHGVSSPKTKTRSEKDAELEKLYRYYVGRVHEVYDNHCRHHRLLFRGDICLRWETPEKVTLLEEDDLGPGLTPSSSRAITPLSQRNSGSWRALLASSRAPTPHSTKASESRRDVDSTEINEGKRKDVDPGLDADVGSHVGGVDGDKAKDKDVDTSTLSSTANTAPKSNKSNKSTIQRLRQLWPTTKARESSADDVELVLEGKKDNGNEETEAQEREQEQEPVV